MTENPVAAANARTMWKRETPPIAAISSSVNVPARWLSIYQSAFWAGFIGHCFRSKRSHHDRLPRASFDRRCSCDAIAALVPLDGNWRKDSAKGLAGNLNSIVHTAFAALI